jgi:UDP-N-acetylmuramoylalanine--D-glutamate ligase
MIDLSPLKPAFGTRPVAVMGLGKSGLVAAEALVRAGIETLAWDDHETRRRAAAALGARIVDLAEADFSGIAALVLSPGIPHTFPKPHTVAARAKAAGVAIIGDVELLLRADPNPRVIAITGTNGKSTTTALIAHILAEAGLRHAVGGNLGFPVLGFASPGSGGVYVLEMSSYQLELTPSLAPDIGVLLNISPDHLDRHGGMEGYIAAKALMFKTAKANAAAVIGVDDTPSAAIAADVAARGGFALTRISTASRADLFLAEGALHDGNGFLFAMNDAPALLGTHNAQNAAAAFSAARALGIGDSTILAALRSFPGLAHRQQLVRTLNGIRYVNDSKATNADAAAKALACFDAIYWIAGGRAKESGLDGLQSLMPRVRKAYLIGEAALPFAAWLERRAPNLVVETLARAVAAAHADAQREKIPGAVVLLSPACASFDQFSNFEARGEHFAELVRSLPAEAA